MAPKYFSSAQPSAPGIGPVGPLPAGCHLGDPHAPTLLFLLGATTYPAAPSRNLGDIPVPFFLTSLKSD